MSAEKRFIITRTPCRVSFTGGGTDIPDYYNKFGTGAVVSAALSKYVYITVSQYFYEGNIRAHYSKNENDVTDINEIQHPLIRECLRFVNLTKGVQITSIADVPAQGTGLGSSSSYTVGLLNALHAYREEKTSPEALAEEAVHIEREVLKEHGGKQDQYVAAFGGILLMEFMKGGKTTVRKAHLNPSDMRELERHMLLIYTGSERSSDSIHVRQAAELGSHLGAYKRMAELAYRQFEAFENGGWRETGKLMHENWMLKKTLASGISDASIDKMYDTAMKNGAEGGKLMGAGGSGFFLFFAEPEKHQQIIDSLKSPGLKVEQFGFNTKGSEVIYRQGFEQTS